MRTDETIEIIEDYLIEAGYALYSLREDYGISYSESLDLIGHMNITGGYASTDAIKERIGRS